MLFMVRLMRLGDDLDVLLAPLFLLLELSLLLLFSLHFFVVAAGAAAAVVLPKCFKYEKSGSIIGTPSRFAPCSLAPK